MRTNTGGQISPNEVIGRERLIARMWRALENQSIVLTAPRRVGKTSILKKIEAEPRNVFVPVYHDLEGLRSPIEFVETVYADVEKFLSGKKKAVKRAKDFIAQFGGAEIKGFKLPSIAATHWKTLLERIVEDLAEHQEETVLFLWDEMPMMLANIRQDVGETTAMEVLDTLRALRQMHPNIRMIYTGSIGLHHVIASLKRGGYANSPVNDMKIMDAPPLEKGDAEHLARLLLEGERIQSTDNDKLAAAVAASADNIPFYIHHVVDGLAESSGVADASAVTSIVGSYLVDAQDRWDMAHYRKRIDTYYLLEERTIALSLLDVLAVSERGLSFDETYDLLASRQEIHDKELARGVVVSLMRDHYVIQEPNGAYRFYLPLIQRWWRLNRGLA